MNKIKKYKNFLLEFNINTSPITDLSGYISKMKKGIGDKLFFLDKINIDTLIDFGCADGSLLGKIDKMNLNIKLIGYDIDPEMINIAKSQYPNINFYSNWPEIIENIDNRGNTAILLSSVIHEIYSYGSTNEINLFWNQIFNTNIKYVIIRDMIPSDIITKPNPKDIEKIKEKSDPKYLTDFENKWGDISSNNKTLLHWLLKYKYTNNWFREVRENYLPISLNQLKSKIPPQWNIIYQKHYTYDYIKNLIKQDFNIELKEKTHLQMIIQNNKY